MKNKLSCQAILLLTLSFCIGCHVDNAKVVETKKLSTECIVGVWTPEEPDEDLNTIEFHAANMEGGENGNVTLLGGIEQSNGTWQYQDIAEIEISTPGISATFKLLNCKRGILKGLIIYTKQP